MRESTRSVWASFAWVLLVVAIIVLPRGGAASSPADLDKVYGLKGGNVRFPSFGDTLTQDYGGWRSRLASAGMGLIASNITRFQNNVLDTPRHGPTFNQFYRSTQRYWGQKPSFSNNSVMFLTYDLGRWGVPDGQLQFSWLFTYATFQGFVPNAFAVNLLAYYQTVFDRRLEIRFGILPSQREFVGQGIGGNVATTTGPANTIVSQLGMSETPVSTPSVVVTANLTDTVYNQVAVMRSLVVNGPTGNPFFDTHELNPTNLRWNVNTSSYSPTAEVGAPGTRALFVEEIGYKRRATPASRYTWARLGAMYNNSTFHDFTKSVADGGLMRGPIGPTVHGNAGFYFLADQQVWKPAASSPAAAGRGIYLGATFMYARPRTTAATRYYEGRLYSRGPFRSRPTDLTSLVVFRQVYSPHLVANLNTLHDQGTYGASETWSATGSYLAHLMPGVYAGVGLSYLKNPSQASYFGPSKANPSQPFQGNALNVQLSLFTYF